MDANCAEAVRKNRFVGLRTLILVGIGVVGGESVSCTVGTGPLLEPGPPNPYSGQAALVLGTIRGFQFTVSNTGILPESGGALETSALDAEVLGVLKAEVAHASVVGEGDLTQAQASLADLDLTVEGHHITLDFLISSATARCSGETPSVVGDFQISTLIVDDDVRTLSTAPNQSFPILDAGGNEIGRVVINEQVTVVSENEGTVTVNALHVVIAGVADIAVGHAHAGIKCIGQSPTADDFVTGGGWITGTPSGDHANFGVAGGIQGGALWGHLTYLDHGEQRKVEGTGVTAYNIVNTTARHIEGTAEINGQGGFTYQVDVADNGEPGTSDTFAITFSDGYSASGVLGGGNIQLHD